MSARKMDPQILNSLQAYHKLDRVTLPANELKTLKHQDKSPISLRVNETRLAQLVHDVQFIDSVDDDKTSHSTCSTALYTF